MDGFYSTPDDDEDPVMMLWRMENDARKRRGSFEGDVERANDAGAVVLEFRAGRI